MIYYLKNKDKIVLEFEVISVENSALGATYYTQDIDKISILSDNLPKNIKTDSYESLKTSLISWIENRKVPENRQFVEKIVSSYTKKDKTDFMDYVDVSLALSLNDAFWITPIDKEYKWSEYNLYKNKFDKALELVAFSGVSHKISGFTLSPEYTTNGMLRKCWHRQNGEIYLYKGSMKEYANWGKEPYCEFYMSEIAKTLGLEHIDYDLKEFHGQIVSSCRIFTNEKDGYLPILYCLNERARKLKGGQLLNEISKIYTESRLKDLLVFDAIIYNNDRHLGNFGMMVDNDTARFLRPAPIFDNGFSIINHLTKDELNDIDTALANKMSYFGYNFDTQLKLFVEYRHLDGLEKLSKFEFKRHEKFNLSDEWLVPVQEHIRQRAKKAICFYKEKNKKIM